MLTYAKRLFIGRPLANSESDHQRLPKTIALATFSSDAISSTAYATEEILFVIAVGGSSLALGLSKLIPIAIVVAVLLAIVSFSYRQTIFAYPSGGGSYIVSRENLGEIPSLVAGASLLVDYTLTVAVSISSGVAAVISIPSLRHLESVRVELCLALVLLVTVANLRGVKESGRMFAVPTYVYILSLGGLIVYGLARTTFGHVDPVPFDPSHAENVLRLTGGNLGLFLLARGFSSGAVALSGVEAISNGVPAFQKPEAKNAATTLTWMATILGTLFLGVSLLAYHLHPFPSHEETVISQMSRALVGTGAFYWILQIATVMILTLAANTAYADFPRLSSIIAEDGYLPRQFANRGDRLVFSNGVIFLAGAAGLLIVIFGGVTSALIPLYAIGVFTSFTLSQTGMVVHHLRIKEPGWRFGAVVNGVGAVSTLLVTLIVGITKFAIGAWVPIVLVPLIILLFKAIKRHYVSVGEALVIEPEDLPRPPHKHTFVVLVGRVHKGVVEAINYAVSLRPDHVVAIHISDDKEDHERIQDEWDRYGFDIPLEILDSPYRELVAPVERHLDELDRRYGSDRTTVLIPEFVVGVRSLSNILHGQSGLSLKLALLDRPNTIVASVPFHIGAEGPLSTTDAPVEKPTGRRVPTHELDRERRAKRFEDGEGDSVRIGDAPRRVPTQIAGEVTGLRVVPKAGSPWLEVTVDDGSGSAVLIFTGRKRVPGIMPGRAIIAEGVARDEHDRLTILNPRYSLHE
ncbi:MAG: amino acid/polyamine/organocation transporter, superfamily [Actinomycetia bacterium]|nr:amino acid/polyamine/organocation transporter, superfamily [Actinomycetes bacterium]